MDVAKRQDHIRGAGGCNRGFGWRLERGDSHLTVKRRIGLELALEGGGPGSPSQRFVQFAVVLEKRRQYLGIPTVARPDLDDGHVGFDPEESERLQRMTILVAR